MFHPSNQSPRSSRAIDFVAKLVSRVATRWAEEAMATCLTPAHLRFLPPLSQACPPSPSPQAWLPSSSLPSYPLPLAAFSYSAQADGRLTQATCDDFARTIFPTLEFMWFSKSEVGSHD